MIKEKAYLLADKLESRGYRQGRGFLKTGPRTFCCLGVACRVAGVKSVVSIYGEWYFEGARTSLPESVRKEFGFHDSYGGRSDGKPIFIDGEKYSNLAEANDRRVRKVPFRKIAKYIRENYKYL